MISLGTTIIAQINAFTLCWTLPQPLPKMASRLTNRPSYTSLWASESESAALFELWHKSSSLAYISTKECTILLAAEAVKHILNWLQQKYKDTCIFAIKQSERSYINCLYLMKALKHNVSPGYFI